MGGCGESSGEVWQFCSGHVPLKKNSGDVFGKLSSRRLRLAGTQPTREDTLSGNRFAALREEEVEVPPADMSVETSESDTESVPDPEFESEEVHVEPEVRFERDHNFQAAFVSVDGITIKEMFKTTAQVLRTVPFFMRGVLRGGFRMTVDAVVAGQESGDRNR